MDQREWIVLGEGEKRGSGLGDVSAQLHQAGNINMARKEVMRTLGLRSSHDPKQAAQR